jgi:hypothetical protein
MVAGCAAHVAQALALLHREIARRWTVEDQPRLAYRVPRY